MIIEYNRPDNLQEAFKLLARQNPQTVPLAGGSVLSHDQGDPLAVVDLQNLGLNKIEIHENTLCIGAAATLQQIYDFTGTPDALKTAVQWEVTSNLRNTSSLAGTLVTADGRSMITTILLAMGTHFTWMPQNKDIFVEDWLAGRSIPKGTLITEIQIPLNGQIQSESIGRTPADTPVVIVSVFQHTSGQKRIAVGGFGPSPLLAVKGVLSTDEAVHAVEKAFGVADDAWASAEYRKNAASILTRRLLNDEAR
jgi:CO/xanthine dehydrogenase FAD-binding subunit